MIQAMTVGKMLDLHSYWQIFIFRNQESQLC